MNVWSNMFGRIALGAIGPNTFDKHVYSTIINFLVFTPKPHQTSFFKHVWTNMFDRTMFGTLFTPEPVWSNMFDQTCLIKQCFPNHLKPVHTRSNNKCLIKHVCKQCLIKHFDCVWTRLYSDYCPLNLLNYQTYSEK